MYNPFYFILIIILCIVFLWIVREKYTKECYNTNYTRNINNSILTYNIQRMPYSTKPLKKLYQFFKNHSIILVQECFLNLMYDDMEYTFHDYNIVKGTMVGYRLINSGLIILSKYKIVSHEFIAFKNKSYLTSDILAEKGFLVAKVTIHNKNVCIINTHLQSNTYKNNYSIALKQWTELHDYIKNIREPWILGGDFNIQFRHVISTYTMYGPRLPTIYIKYIDNVEHDTSCIERKQYEPFVFDYFITNNVYLTRPVPLEFLYSDHLPVSSKFFMIETN